MGGRGGSPNSGQPATAAPAAAPPSAEAQIRQAHSRLEERPGAWVPLADLRMELSGLTREQQDTALKEIALKPGVQIIPWDNKNALGPRDRAAALRFGGEDNHAIRIERG